MRKTKWSMIKCAMIGYGYWGPNLVRNFAATPNTLVHTVADLRPERLALVSKAYPSIQVTSDIDSLWSNPEIDAVIIATPVFTHFELARKALKAGKHVLLEKPMTDTVVHAEELIALSKEHGKVLMVDHTFLYTSAVHKMKSLIDSGELGAVKYFDSTRINLGLIQQDVNVLWDLAPHDISILDYLIAESPTSVQATGISHIHNGIENIAYLTVKYAHDFIAHFHCSWSSPVKIRTMWVGGDTGNFSATAKRLYVHPAYANRVRSLLEARKKKGAHKEYSGKGQLWIEGGYLPRWTQDDLLDFCKKTLKWKNAALIVFTQDANTDRFEVTTNFPKAA